MVHQPLRTTLTLLCLWATTACWHAGAAAKAGAAEPLHVQIDRLIEQGYASRKAQPAEQTDDAEFVRRVYLDLNGMIPTATQTAAFLEDADPNKRSQLIQRLVDSPEYARRMQTFFDVLLMERQGGKNVSQQDWEQFLRDSLASGKPYNEMIREIIAADGVDKEKRGPARFVLDRPAETDVLVRDVARLLLGRDMTCAQCHDHPVVNDYYQSDYFGLYAYFSRTFVFADKKAKRSMLAEKATSEVTFKSVFIPDETHQAGPHVLDGPAVEEPEFAEGEEYEVKPVKDNSVRPVPKFRLRERLAQDLTGGEVDAFSRNIVNRLWTMMMGRGLVHPLDLHHSENPPSHPAVLDLLVKEFEQQNYNIRLLLRELALTKTYQLSSRLPQGATAADVPVEAFAVAVLKPLTPEQLGWSLLASNGQVESARTAQLALAEKDKELSKLAADDPTRPARIAEFVEAGVYKQLQGNVTPFQAQFGESGPPRPEFDATASQALYLANGTQLHTWSVAIARSLATKHPADPAALTKELYLQIFSRRPDPAEVELVTAQLADVDPAERSKIISDLVWSLLTSMEYRFNH